MDWSTGVVANWIAVADVAIQAGLLGVTVWIGKKVYELTQKVEKQNQYNAALASLNQLNATALSSPENLMAFDGIYRDTRDRSPDATRRRWATFMALQTHQQLYLANRENMIPKSDLDRHSDQVLDLLLRDSEIVSLVKQRGFEESFAQYCENRAHHLAQRDRELQSRVGEVTP